MWHCVAHIYGGRIMYLISMALILQRLIFSPCNHCRCRWGPKKLQMTIQQFCCQFFARQSWRNLYKIQINKYKYKCKYTNLLPGPRSSKLESESTDSEEASSPPDPTCVCPYICVCSYICVCPLHLCLFLHLYLSFTFVFVLTFVFVFVFVTF